MTIKTTIKTTIQTAIDKFYPNVTTTKIGTYIIGINKNISGGYINFMLCGHSPNELDSDLAEINISFGIVSLGDNRFLVHTPLEWAPTNTETLNNLFIQLIKGI